MWGQNKAAHQGLKPGAKSVARWERAKPLQKYRNCGYTWQPCGGLNPEQGRFLAIRDGGEQRHALWLAHNISAGVIRATGRCCRTRGRCQRTHSCACTCTKTRVSTLTRHVRYVWELRRVAAGHREALPHKLPARLRDLIQRCWAHNSADRWALKCASYYCCATLVNRLQVRGRSCSRQAPLLVTTQCMQLLGGHASKQAHEGGEGAAAAAACVDHKMPCCTEP